MDIKEHWQLWYISEVGVYEKLAEEFHEPIIKKFKRIKVYARIKDNIWAVDLAEMGSLSSKNKNVIENNTYYVL